jgi:hypothetical protein
VAIDWLGTHDLKNILNYFRILFLWLIKKLRRVEIMLELIIRMYQSWIMIRYYIWSSNNICCAKSGIVAITSLKKNYFIKSVCLKLYFDIHENKMKMHSYICYKFIRFYFRYKRIYGKKKFFLKKSREKSFINMRINSCIIIN